MITYICAEGHIQYSASPTTEETYFPRCSRINCQLEVVELPKMKPMPPLKGLEAQVRDAVEGRR